MKKVLLKNMLLLIGFLSMASAFAQSAGFNQSFIVLNVNNGGNTYYDLQASTANADFNGASLGTYCQGASSGIVFKGAEHKVYKCGGCDLQSTRLMYRIYPTGSPSGSFVSNNVGYASGFTNGCGGEDQTWANTGYSTSLTSSLPAGNYTLEVYSEATTTCFGGTVYAGNNGANYKATFTIAGNVNYYADADGDGFGNAGAPTVSCTGAPSGYVSNASDCNDSQLQYNDADGDGFGGDTLVACGVSNTADCDDLQSQYADLDGDGFGSVVKVACGVTNSTDCNDEQFQYQDADGDGFGSTVKVACGVTNNVDCDDLQSQYADLDGDGFGSVVKVACGVTNSTECNDEQFQYQDADGDGFGSTVKVACGVTNNVDCDDLQSQYADLDGDGFGSVVKVACGVTNSTDCNDAQLQYTDADGDGFGSDTLAACGVSNSDDCNDLQLQYADNDGDGFGSTTYAACGVTNNSDCDDSQIRYADNDNDGAGSTTMVACGGVATNFDCDDTDPLVISSSNTYYADADGDGYGNAAASAISCTAPAGYVSNSTDCDDANNQVNPGHLEVYYNGIDDNCDGQLDEGNQIKTQLYPQYCGITLNQIYQGLAVNYMIP
ncbi:MAG TPA: putative metal-binding motif-containing protein, partial [Flavobacterium sp.]